MALVSRLGASAGLIAALSMISAPAAAADTPAGLLSNSGEGSAVFTTFDTTPFRSSTYDVDTDISEWRGRRGCGWRCRRRGGGAGGVLAGVLVLGGIAAIASAANNNNRRRPREVIVIPRDRDRDRYEDRDFDRRELDYDRDYDRDYDNRTYDRRDDRRFEGEGRRDSRTTGLQGAIDQCVNEVQRNVRVDGVDTVDRTSRGWIVSGSLFNGSGFTCAIDNSGQIDAIDYSGEARGDLGQRSSQRSAPARVDGQWDDRSYLSARDQRRPREPYRVDSYQSGERPAEPLVPLTSGRVPAYPGGPLPGEE